ncbi:DNA helicase [Tanacetum coccineum]
MSHIDCIHPDDDEGDGGSVLGDSFAFQQSGHRRELSRPTVYTVSIGGNVTPPLSNEKRQVLDNHEDHRVTVSGDRRNVSMRSSTETHDVLDTTMVPLSRVFERFRNLGSKAFDRQTTDDEDHRRPVSGDRGNIQTTTAGAAGVGTEVGSPSTIAPVNHAYLCLNVTDCVIRPGIIPFLNSRLENAYQDHARVDSSNTIDLMSPHNKAPVSDECSTSVNEHIVELSCLQSATSGASSSSRYAPRRLFRTARDRYNAGEIPSFKIRLYNKGGARGYEFPTSDVLGGIVFEDGPKSRTDFDVIIEFRGGHPQRINKLHQSYMSLQFPLLFVFGEPGFYPELVLKPRDGSGKGKKVTMNAYYKYQLHPRVKGFGLIFRCGRLFQQYVVAAFCAIEQSRLDFIRKRQNDLRSDYLLGLYDAISQGDREGIQAGSMIMLPRTFTGGPRYMYNHYFDALAICRSLGNPQFFITFRCNVKWPEIKRYMSQYPHLTPTDRADIVCRVFEQKVNDFINFLKFERPFGFVIAFLYTIEFQKRGLPHCHTLLWVDSSSKIQDASQIDDYISAELPDPVEDPEGYKIVSKLMMHGPCGVANPSASCLLGDDREWDIALKEPDPPKLWRKHWEAMHNDIQAKISKATGIVNYHWKTFLWKTIISWFRSQGKIVLAVALSGIASLLLPAGRTTHSRFKLPLELTDESVCHAKKHSQLGNLLVETNLIIWDEAPMNDKRCFEALDRILRDLMNAPEILFGGKTIILGGDFRQTLSVKKGAAKQELIHASIAESYLWLHFRICTLKQNMRLLRSAISDDERERSKVFAKWLLDVGNGEVGEPDKDNNEDTFWITVPQQYCINPSEQALSELINFIYDEDTLKTPTASAFHEKAIVCLKNDTADVVNARILSSVEGVTKTYLSRDEAIPLGRETSKTDMLYPMEYLNTITFPGFPPYKLQLKVGSPIMLLRNVNLSVGLCNGTRMIVISLMSRLIEAQIITGTRVGEKAIHTNVCNSYCISKSWTRRLRNRSKSISEMDLQKYSRDERSSILLHSNRQREYCDTGNHGPQKPHLF